MAAVSEEAKARRKAQKRAYYAANRSRELARTAAWCLANPERSAEIKRKWRNRNPEADRKYYERNKERSYAQRDAYRRRCKEAMPEWVDRRAILNVYKEAKRLGLSVDHIVPLHNPTVCGLHVPWNLQLLPLEDNIRKGNKHAG